LKVIYIGPHDGVEVPLDPGNAMSSWAVAERDGKPVDLPDKLAKGLIAEQPSNWQPAKPAKKEQP
jgi:hypothetical protein